MLLHAHVLCLPGMALWQPSGHRHKRKLDADKWECVGLQGAGMLVVPFH